MDASFTIHDICIHPKLGEWKETPESNCLYIEENHGGGGLFLHGTVEDFRRFAEGLLAQLPTTVDSLVEDTATVEVQP